MHCPRKKKYKHFLTFFTGTVFAYGQTASGKTYASI